MKRTVLILWLVAPFMLSCQKGSAYKAGSNQAAMTATASEKDILIAKFESNTKAFEAAVSGLTPKQWTFHESPERWSIGEVVEHIVLSETALRNLISESVLSTEPNSAIADSVKITDEAMIQVMADRSQKYQAPEFAIPKGVYALPDDAKTAFSAERAATMKVLESIREENLRRLYGAHPAFGQIEAYKRFLLVVSHCDRHLAQIAQVKADPDYPTGA